MIAGRNAPLFLARRTESCATRIPGTTFVRAGITSGLNLFTIPVRIIDVMAAVFILIALIGLVVVGRRIFAASPGRAGQDEKANHQ